MSYRSMTISTCGLVDGIGRLAKEGLPVNLAVSLHETDQSAREALMPVANSYNLDELFPPSGTTATRRNSGLPWNTH